MYSFYDEPQRSVQAAIKASQVPHSRSCLHSMPHRPGCVGCMRASFAEGRRQYSLHQGLVFHGHQQLMRAFLLGAQWQKRAERRMK